MDPQKTTPNLSEQRYLTCCSILTNLRNDVSPHKLWGEHDRVNGPKEARRRGKKFFMQRLLDQLATLLVANPGDCVALALVRITTDTITMAASHDALRGVVWREGDTKAWDMEDVAELEAEQARTTNRIKSHGEKIFKHLRRHHTTDSMDEDTRQDIRRDLLTEQTIYSLNKIQARSKGILRQISKLRRIDLEQYELSEPEIKDSAYDVRSLLIDRECESEAADDLRSIFLGVERENENLGRRGREVVEYLNAHPKLSTNLDSREKFLIWHELFLWLFERVDQGIEYCIEFRDRQVPSQRKDTEGLDMLREMVTELEHFLATILEVVLKSSVFRTWVYIMQQILDGRGEPRRGPVVINTPYGLSTESLDQFVSSPDSSTWDSDVEAILGSQTSSQSFGEGWINRISSAISLVPGSSAVRKRKFAAEDNQSGDEEEPDGGCGSLKRFLGESLASAWGMIGLTNGPDAVENATSIRFPDGASSSSSRAVFDVPSDLYSGTHQKEGEGESKGQQTSCIGESSGDNTSSEASAKTGRRIPEESGEPLRSRYWHRGNGNQYGDKDDIQSEEDEGELPEYEGGNDESGDEESDENGDSDDEESDDDESDDDEEEEEDLEDLDFIFLKDPEKDEDDPENTLFRRVFALVYHRLIVPSIFQIPTLERCTLNHKFELNVVSPVERTHIPFKTEPLEDTLNALFSSQYDFRTPSEIEDMLDTFIEDLQSPETIPSEVRRRKLFDHAREDHTTAAPQHPELIMLEHLLRKKSHRTRSYIGTSKPPCAVCESVLDRYWRTPRIDARKGRGRVCISEIPKGLPEGDRRCAFDAIMGFAKTVAAREYSHRRRLQNLSDRAASGSGSDYDSCSGSGSNSSSSPGSDPDSSSGPSSGSLDSGIANRRSLQEPGPPDEMGLDTEVAQRLAVKRETLGRSDASEDDA
ncbi:hypothetical protein TWF481_007661 [Arthrobotrys musiformis]|uniref:Uncharacterized protein n=1 Tax=Arthrobotrys musiformis TaxID=47236 RepID=A0AAV9WED9_9PEZI